LAVQQMSDREERAWIEPLVQSLGRPAWNLAMMYVNDSEVARDVVQEAFLSLWRHPGTPRDERGFKAWLLRSVANRSVDHRRRTSRWERLFLRPPVPADPGDQAEGRWVESRIAAALNELNWRERVAVYLRFFEEASYEEIATIIGKREGASRVLVHRALSRLRKRLAAEGLDPKETS
jgi:RNA polymerase sigma factor (sigma-70 family)